MVLFLALESFLHCWCEFDRASS